MPPLDITHEPAVTIDGKVLPVALIRALAHGGTGRVRLELDDGSVEEIEISAPSPGQLSFARHPRSRKGNDGNPVETEGRAELVAPGGAERKWVTRGDPEHQRLVDLDWKEVGRTRPRLIPAVVRQEPDDTRGPGR